MKTKKVMKAPLAKNEERMFVDPPYTIIGSSTIPESFCLTMKVGGLLQMLKDLEGEDVFRIEVFGGYRATEFSYIKHKEEKGAPCTT